MGGSAAALAPTKEFDLPAIVGVGATREKKRPSLIYHNFPAFLSRNVAARYRFPIQLTMKNWRFQPKQLRG